MNTTVQKINSKSGNEIAYRRFIATNTELPSVIFFGGFISDMYGSKASFLEKKCIERGQGFIRFDYSGQGQSSGEFINCTIGDWLQDAVSVLDQLTDGSQILVGSSMGGWIALLLSLRRLDRIAGIVGIAAAPDFTEDIYGVELNPSQKQELEDNGVVYLPSDYGEPYPITKKLIDDAKNYLLLNNDNLLDIKCPVRLLHGKKDTIVPHELSLEIKEKLGSTDVAVHMIDDGDHSLSCKAGLTLLDGAVQAINSIVSITN